MKISLDWLNSYLDQPVSADQAASALTDVGFPIETQQTLPWGDTMLDVEITSNRPDCLCHLGLAYEVAAALQRRVLPPPTDPPELSEAPAIDSLTSIQVLEPDLCPLYIARLIQGVRIGPSPDWLVRRLEAIGLRSINNVVDVTNYVMFELGQPLHAFDFHRLAGRCIVVRRAHPQEPFTALDGSQHTLAPDMLVIADAEKPVALAGVMGGLNSEVHPGTTDILLEAAAFAPLSIRRTSRRLKLASESSYRFERSLDLATTDRASRRAAALIVELAGGRLARGALRIGPPDPSPRSLTLRTARAKAILGMNLSPAAMTSLLERLNLAPVLSDDQSTITCTIPTRRLDLKREIDLIEEVGRLAGYQHIRLHRKISVQARPLQSDIAALRQLHHVLTAHGFFETITFSFIQPQQGQPFIPPDAQPVLIDDERRKKEPLLRPSLLPSLLICRKTNQDVGNRDVRLFETAAVWLRRNGQIVETRKLALLADLDTLLPQPQPTDPLTRHQTAIRAMSSILCELIERLLGTAPSVEPAELAFLSPAAQLIHNGKRLGHFGLAAPALYPIFELRQPVALAELDLEPLLAGYPPPRQVQPLARFPAIERDLSIVIDEALSWARVRQEILQARLPLLEELRFVTTYRGQPIPPGKKSLTFRLVFRDPQTTLRHEQIDPQVQSLIDHLARTLGAQLRQ